MDHAIELDEQIGLLAAQIHSLSAQLIQKLGELNARDGWKGDGYRTLTQWLSVRCKFTTQEAARFARLAIKQDELGALLDHGNAGRLSPGVIEHAGRVTTSSNADEIANAAVKLTPSQGQKLFSKMRREQEIAAHTPRPHIDDDGNEVAPPAPPKPDYWWREWTDELGRGRIDAALDPLIAAQLSAAWEASRRQGHRLEMKNRKTAESSSSSDSINGSEPQRGKASPSMSPGSFPTSGSTTDEEPGGSHGSNDEGVRFSFAPWNDVNQIAGILADSVIKELESTGLTRIGGSRFHVQVTADVETVAEALGIDIKKTENAAIRLGREAFDAQSGRNLTDVELSRICCDADISLLVHKNGRPLWLGNTVRNATHHQRRALLYRSRGSSPTGAGCCEFPGCTNNRYVEAHHVHFHENGGATTLDNFVLLCSWHHDELHAGRIRIEAHGAQCFTFFDAKGRRVGTNVSSLQNLNGPPDANPEAQLTDLPPPESGLLPQHVDTDSPRAHSADTPLKGSSLNKLLTDLLCA